MTISLYHSLYHHGEAGTFVPWFVLGSNVGKEGVPVKGLDYVMVLVSVPLPRTPPFCLVVAPTVLAPPVVSVCASLSHPE